MAKVRVDTTLTIELSSGDTYAITETKTTIAGDNPRYLGEHVYYATTEIAERFRPSVEARFGKKPE